MSEEQPEPPPVATPSPRDGDPASNVVPIRGRLSEATLVARAQDGDVSAFEELVRAYQGPLFRLAYRMLFDRAEAEDAVQDSLVLAWRKLVTLADPVTFPAWIYQLTSRRCLNVIRSRERARTSVGGIDDLSTTVAQLRPAPAADEPPVVAQTRGLQHGLEHALSELPAELRICWVLKELQDLSYPEIAGILGVPVSTVRGRLARARISLAKGMASWQ